uniref:Cytotoxin 3a n=1 Tax=Naja atra TaxID=8656 RepID=3SA3A_NAJAT|nr:RecName: Full=Cytotoxin 3a; AltName: Full=Cardiotoxin-31; Short=Ctx-31; AltName: Full=Cardiotoxin-3a; Flags: Precursor [Naja atra]AAB18383.1 cardiotoxin 3a [Naja atra]CAB42053.1 cardiotoxin-31 [Naja atra]
MKTLLLTLVVVTIVCLDLGYTLKCNKLVPLFYKTCPAGKNLCYKMFMVATPKVPVKRGCIDVCPKNSLLVKYVCCNTDRCN